MGWEISDGTDQVGPFDEDHVIRMIAAGLDDGSLVRENGGEWKRPRSHLAFAQAFERRALPAVVASAAPAATATAYCEQKSEFAGVGCLVQAFGFVVAGLLFLVAAVPGAVIGLAVIVGLFIYGRGLANYYACSACGTKLANSLVSTCPACRAALSSRN